MRIDQVLQDARQSKERYLSELKEFLRIPTISTLSEHEPDIRRGAEWVSEQLAGLGFRHVEIVPTNGHPVICGESLETPSRRTILIYGHYDVQPADPLSEWTSQPFEPNVRGEDLFARGASDMKGNLHAALKALEAWRKEGGLPINVRVLFEGEEELGSPNLGAFIDAHKDRLKCDLVLNLDGGILKPDLPSLTYGLRGIVYVELSVYGAERDLHSGEFGGSVHNPAQVLCELIAGMHDADGHVTLPGFYDQVRILSDEERQELARFPLSDKEWRQIARAGHLYGEKGFTTIERLGARPTLEVNGLLSGFTGEGSKTVIPAKAMAKISMRLVPFQDEKLIEEGFREYLRKNAPETVRWEVKELTSEPGILIKRDTPGMRAASKALETIFGVKPVFRLEGGSIAVASILKTKLGLDSVIMGFSLPDDNIHAPNEKLHLPTYYRGIEAYIRFLELISTASLTEWSTG